MKQGQASIFLPTEEELVKQLKAGLERKPNRLGRSKKREFSQELSLSEELTAPLLYRDLKTGDPTETSQLDQLLTNLEKGALKKLKEECIQYLVMGLIPRYEGLEDQDQEKGRLFQEIKEVVRYLKAVAEKLQKHQLGSKSKVAGHATLFLTWCYILSQPNYTKEQPTADAVASSGVVNTASGRELQNPDRVSAVAAAAAGSGSMFDPADSDSESQTEEADSNEAPTNGPRSQ